MTDTDTRFVHNFLSLLLKFHKITLLFLLVSLAFFTRFYNLEETATFFWDTAYDLKQISQYYQQREITLVGPISEQGDKVYSSLTYYMLMPFAVLGRFDIASTTYGATVYGFVTAVLLLILTYRINRKIVVPVALLLAIWFPLVETSRWAWNPNLVTLWIVIGLLLYQTKTNVSHFLAGLALGMTIHHHYLAAIATSVFIIWTVAAAIRNKQAMKYVGMIGGYLCAIAPFVVFDVLHPPGLFLTRLIYFNQTEAVASVWDLLTKSIANFASVFQNYTHSSVLSVAIIVMVVGLIMYDWRTSRTYLKCIVPWLIQVLAIAGINASNQHYFLPGLVFFFVYLIVPRAKFGRYLAYAMIGVLILGSLFTLWPQLTTQRYVPLGWQPNIRTVRAITKVLKDEITTKSLQGVNLTVLGSTDPNLYGWKYRSLLEIENVPLSTKGDYFSNSYLFVISQATEDNLRAHRATELDRFRDQRLRNSWRVADSEWNVFLFSF